MVDLNLALLIAELYAEPDVRRQGFGLLLRQRRHDGHQHLALGVERVDVLLLEVYEKHAILHIMCIYSVLCSIYMYILCFYCINMRRCFCIVACLSLKSVKLHSSFLKDIL